jgi:hypothetical protein
MNATHRQALQAAARSATPADLSILQAALAELSPDRPTMLTTTPGSNNDRLWSEMVALGWLTAADPLDVPVPSKVYAVNPAAGEEIRGFLDDHARGEAMTAIINDFREKIPPMVLDAVRGADGTPADVAIVLAAVVEGTMRRGIKPALHDEFLREVAKVAEGMRAV